jgi:hypothetical protein
MPDAAEVEAARDFLDQEFGEPTGYTWMGTDVARLSRHELVAIVILLGKNKRGDIARLPRRELIRLVILFGKQEGIYDYNSAVARK